MKKMALVLSIMLLTNTMANLVYANTSPYTIDKTTINGLHSATRQSKVKDIIITEPAPGLFEKDKTIYLKADRLLFEDGATVEITKGNIRIKKIDADGDILKITIEKASSQASEIKISNIKFYLDGNLADGTYDLDLITEESATYPNNVFGGFYEQSTKRGNDATSFVTLIKDFVTISTTPRDKQETPVMYRDIISIPMSEQDINSEQAYLYNGTIMIPLRAVTENLSDSVSVQWDEETKTIVIRSGQRIGSIQIGSNIMNLNGVATPMKTAPEIRNNRVFIAVEDIAYLLGINENNIQWNTETLTVTLN